MVVLFFAILISYFGWRIKNRPMEWYWKLYDIFARQELSALQLSSLKRYVGHIYYVISAILFSMFILVTFTDWNDDLVLNIGRILIIIIALVLTFIMNHRIKRL